MRSTAAAAPIPTEPLPPTFRYRSIRPAFSVFGYAVEVERDVLEFLDLVDVSTGGSASRSISARRTQEQFTVGARAFQDLPGYFTSRTVTITRAADAAPTAAVVEPAATAARVASG